MTDELYEVAKKLLKYYEATNRPDILDGQAVPSAIALAHAVVEEYEREAKIGYMCGVDFNYEVGQALGGNTIYASEADLIANKGCTDECGIVEVEVRLKRVIKEEDHSIKPDKTYSVVSRDKDGKRTVKRLTGKELLESRKK